MHRLSLLVAALVGAAGLLGPVPAEAGGPLRDVRMYDNRFVPADLTVAQGRGVEFDNVGRVVHDAVDGTGLDLFATDVFGPPQSEAIDPLPGAGSYRYYCTFHPEMVGTLRVPLRASHANRPRGALVTIRWAEDRAPTGLVFDVQRRRPGAAQFRTWHTGVRAVKASFRPDRRGTWSIRARVREVGGPATSGWSPVRALRVT